MSEIIQNSAYPWQLVASFSAIYSTSVEESAIHDCRLLLQLIAPNPNMIT